MKRKINHVLHVYSPHCAGFFGVRLLRRVGVIIACLLLHIAVFCQQGTTIQRAKVVYGVASFYSKHLEGSKTATGEIFHHDQMVAASNSFELNSWVRITNMRNNKSVIVRINDRMSKGMQALGRVADVTISAAQQLGFINRGLARVKVEQVLPGTTK
ncbi:septal ring lytic transglycosylase RlpA family protein [Ilyomonas limi]|uniref:Probable endolytic peptidoglycan transglycosylase RlpA n=1 Tax=Ilyomonas limi TaxID=2575867 RepID=A0A4U3L6N3_9BACT|nr:septal ring lytic transglycosylase RlpA family protein [Ilyomonas limi]TKK70898.1 septal ring lytic transglycosylase RlpA family protein [Ilyomonas limi]